MKENKKLVNEIISDVKHDMSNEEIIALLADSRIAANPDKEKYTFGQRAADKIAKFAGSWASYSLSPPCSFSGWSGMSYSQSAPLTLIRLSC